MTVHRCNPEGFRNTLKNAAQAGKEVFFRFYQDGFDYKNNGRIFNTQLMPFIEKHKIKTGSLLDIGCGSGGILYHASPHFDTVYGVDVHREQDLVESHLFHKGVFNKVLLKGDGTNIPLPDNTIDCAFSWTVFMHFGLVSVVESYMKEIYRTLSDGGYALIYFARLKRSERNQVKEEWEEDMRRELEGPDLYKEIPGKAVNKINLLISMHWMVETCKRIGFEIVEKTASGMAIHGIKQYHGQHGLLIKKG